MYYGAWSIDCIVLRSHDGMTGSGWGRIQEFWAVVHVASLAGSLNCMRGHGCVGVVATNVHFSSYDEFYALSLRRSFTRILINLVPSPCSYH
jgi:hypothetical protein